MSASQMQSGCTFPRKCYEPVKKLRVISRVCCHSGHVTATVIWICSLSALDWIGRHGAHVCGILTARRDWWTGVSGFCPPWLPLPKRALTNDLPAWGNRNALVPYWRGCIDCSGRVHFFPPGGWRRNWHADILTLEPGLPGKPDGDATLSALT